VFPVLLRLFPTSRRCRSSAQRLPEKIEAAVAAAADAAALERGGGRRKTRMFAVSLP
jgi:hypothetical protein